MVGLINTYYSKKIKQYIGSSKDLYQRLMFILKVVILIVDYKEV